MNHASISSVPLFALGVWKLGGGVSFLCRLNGNQGVDNVHAPVLEQDGEFDSHLREAVGHYRDVERDEEPPELLQLDMRTEPMPDLCISCGENAAIYQGQHRNRDSRSKLPVKYASEPAWYVLAVEHEQGLGQGAKQGEKHNKKDG